MDTYIDFAKSLTQIYQLLKTEYASDFNDEKSLLKVSGTIGTLAGLLDGSISLVSIDNAIFIASTGKCALPSADKTHDVPKNATEASLLFGIHQVDNLLLNFILQLECLILHAEYMFKLRDDLIIRKVLSKKKDIKKTIDITIKQALQGNIDNDVRIMVETFMIDAKFADLREEIGLINKAEKKVLGKIEKDNNFLVDRAIEDDLGEDDFFEHITMGDEQNIKEHSENIAWDNGTYIGNVEDNLPSGKGTWKSDSGASYNGDWRDGEKHGYGTMTYSNGTKYIGEFKNNLRIGKGKVSNPDGSSYSGEWDNNKPQGKGLITYKSGSSYKGEINNGKRHGFGTFFYSNGRQLEGEWENGNFIRPKMKNLVNKEEETIINSATPQKEKQSEHSLFNFKYERNFIQAIGFYLFFVVLRFLFAGVIGFITGSPTTLDYGNYELWMVVEDMISTIYTMAIYFTVYKEKNLQSAFLIILGLLSGAIAWGFGVLYSFIPIAYLTTLKVNK